MTNQSKLAMAKMNLLNLAEFLKNVSEACRINGVSRQHFYDIKKAYEEGGLEALKEKTRRKPNLKNRIAPEIEKEVVTIAVEQPAYGQVRASNELRQKGVLVSPGGVRSIWVRHGLETFKKRLTRLEEKSAREGIVFTEAQLVALERVKKEKESDPEEIETHHPGYLISQDTFYVGYIKGVGRIYQQSVVDTYSSVGFAKLYDTKVPVTAADCLNDRVLPFFESHDVKVHRVLTDRGTEYCGRDDKHPFEIYLALNEIEHSRTKARHPQTNGICERFHQTCLSEFYKVAFRKKVYRTLEELQKDLDDFMTEYNESRTHQGKRCQGRTPMKTFLDGLPLVREKQIEPPPEPARMGSQNSSETARAAAAPSKIKPV
ncbi:MAG: IS481 family transposase [Planctomycetota bacterium]